MGQFKPQMTVMTEQNLTRAAGHLAMTQPAVSNALARLRGVFGDPLFLRTPGGMDATPFARELAEPVNLLSGVDKYSVLDYALSASISETSTLEVHAVTLSEYAESGMTRATMHNATHHFADSIAGRLTIANELVLQPGRLVYVYIPELDQTAHKFGVASSNWQELLDRKSVV